MIRYSNQGRLFCAKLLQLEGSVFPHALLIALPCALLATALTAAIKFGFVQEWESSRESILVDNAAFSAFSFLVGFLTVFRTSQSHSRFWDGCTSTHQMRAEWFDGCSSLIAFCKASKADEIHVKMFQNTLARLFSMLHAAALAAIELGAYDDPCSDSSYHAFTYEVLGIDGIDEESLCTVRDSAAKVELIFQWIQQLIVDNIATNVLAIPPPILSRSFQEIANGMVMFHDAMKISYVPFPFPYAQSCDFLLILHWMVIPIVTSQWVAEPLWAFVFSFVQVFILWCLNLIAIELENPFGCDANDIDAAIMQLEMNEHLCLLLHPSCRRMPELKLDATDFTDPGAWHGHSLLCRVGAPSTFSDCWKRIDAGTRPTTRATHCGEASHTVPTIPRFEGKEPTTIGVVESAQKDPGTVCPSSSCQTCQRRYSLISSTSNSGTPSTEADDALIETSAVYDIDSRMIVSTGT